MRAEHLRPEVEAKNVVCRGRGRGAGGASFPLGALAFRLGGGEDSELDCSSDTSGGITTCLTARRLGGGAGSKGAGGGVSAFLRTLCLGGSGTVGASGGSATGSSALALRRRMGLGASAASASFGTKNFQRPGANGEDRGPMSAL